MTELRLLNSGDIGCGNLPGAKKIQRKLIRNSLNYFRGLITGVATGGVASLIFGAFLFIYMKLDAGLNENHNRE